MGVGVVLWGTASGPDAVFLPVAAWERYAVAGALVAGSALALLSLRVDHSGLAASAWIAVGLGIALAVTAHGYPPRFAKDHDYPGVARRIAPLLDPAQPLLAYPDASLAWDFYLRSPVSEVRSEGEATALLAASPRRVSCSAADAASQAQGDPGWRCSTNARWAVAARVLGLRTGDRHVPASKIDTSSSTSRLAPRRLLPRGARCSSRRYRTAWCQAAGLSRFGADHHGFRSWDAGRSPRATARHQAAGAASTTSLRIGISREVSAPDVLKSTRVPIVFEGRRRAAVKSRWSLPIPTATLEIYWNTTRSAPTATPPRAPVRQARPLEDAVANPVDGQTLPTNFR